MSDATADGTTTTEMSPIAPATSFPLNLLDFISCFLSHLMVHSFCSDQDPTVFRWCVLYDITAPFVYPPILGGYDIYPKDSNDLV